jgi:hypothetical protein
VKNWLLALGTAAFGISMRFFVPPNGAMHIFSVAMILLAAFLIIARVAGINLEDLRQEKEIFQAMFGKKEKK